MTMEIVVAETDPALMAAAVKTATALAGELHARITVLGVAQVPWPADLVASSDVEERFERRVRDYARGAQQDLNGRLVFARERETAYKDCVPRDSLVVIPTRDRGWWHTR
jgi:hypothetical protein